MQFGSWFSPLKCLIGSHFISRLQPGNVDRTIEVVGKLSNLMETWILEGAIKAETLYGVELLNEPFGIVEDIWWVVI